MACILDVSGDKAPLRTVLLRQAFELRKIALQHMRQKKLESEDGHPITRSVLGSGSCMDPRDSFFVWLPLAPRFVARAMSVDFMDALITVYKAVLADGEGLKQALQAKALCPACLRH